MISKIPIYIILTATLFTSCNQSSKKYDERAIASFDKLSETIGVMESCSYTLNTFVSNKSGEKYSNENDVYMRGPDKMYIHTIGTKGEKSYWYDGKQMAYFIFNENKYDTVSAPGNIIDAIDYLHHKYNIDFPAADFFYPTFTDDMLDNFDQILFYGDENIDHIDCVVSEAINDNYIAQIWIEKNTNLPHKLVITYSRDSLRYYEAVFSNWRVNPELPDILFEFEPPANSTHFQLKTKS